VPLEQVQQRQALVQLQRQALFQLQVLVQLPQRVPQQILVTLWLLPWCCFG
jgi:hypothetical protein